MNFEWLLPAILTGRKGSIPEIQVAREPPFAPRSRAQSALRAVGISLTAEGGATLPLDESVLLLTFPVKAAQEIDARIG